MKMSIYEYDKEKHMQALREESREGAQKEIALRMLKTGKLTIEEIAECSGLSVEEVEQLAEILVI